MNYFPQAQKTFQPPLIANENAFLGDITSSEKQDAVSPMSCGLYRLEKGTPLVYEYTVSTISYYLTLSYSFSVALRETCFCVWNNSATESYSLAEKNDARNSI